MGLILFVFIAAFVIYIVVSFKDILTSKVQLWIRLLGAAILAVPIVSMIVQIIVNW